MGACTVSTENAWREGDRGTDEWERPVVPRCCKPMVEGLWLIHGSFHEGLFPQRGAQIL